MNLKKPMLLSFATGCLLSVPWLSGSFSWVLLFAFIPLLMVEDDIVGNKHGKGSIVLFTYAFMAFLLWNILSTWWIGYVSLVGMLLIVVINAFLMAGVWWLMHGVHRRFDRCTAYFSLTAGWLTFEYLHFHWSMQWPWLTLGNGFANSVKWIQWFEYTGVLGGSLWILLVNILLYSIYKYRIENHRVHSIKLAFGLLLLIALPAGGSLYRYHTYAQSGETIQVAVLQPNIDPYKDKFSGMSAKNQTQRLLALAESIVTDSTRYVVAPETALAPMCEDSLQQNSNLKMLQAFINNHQQASFIAGALTQMKIQAADSVCYTSRKMNAGGFYNVFNSAILLDHSLQWQVGHKSILVSGVEKMPFQRYFAFLGKYVLEAGGMSGSLTAANRPTVFKGEIGKRAGPVICFESAFGEYVGSVVRHGANCLFIITNDGWWKESAGLNQHFGFARLRAVETRRSIARSANTGISGFINERGDVLKMTSANSSVAISSPVSLNNSLTFYVKNGDYLGWISSILVVLILLYWIGNRHLGISRQ